MEERLILDRYRPLADLGSGGHGSVVLAFDTKMTRRVAIKRLPLPVGPASTKTGLAEARTAALLNHPNIVIVHEWDTDSDEAFIVMEDLDGASLADLLDETREPFTPDEAAAILAAVSAALSFAHANGVLHLDLKPANVLVTREGRVKVADFGVSALTDVTGSATGTAGTIGYMPPEQIRGQRLDERTDCWALAALAYELLTDANPFDADSAEGSLFKIEVADLPAPSEFEPGLSDAIDDVLLAALAADPDERYASVADLSRALLPFLGDPEAGRESLAALVTGMTDDEPADEYPALGLWDRLAARSGLARRAAGALASAWLLWTGVGSLGLGGGPRLAAAAVAALAGALAPGLGIALGLLALIAGIVGAVGWPAGLLALGVLGLHWALRGRSGAGDAASALYGPLLGALRAAPATPLLLGFVFPPVTAAISAGVAALATMAAAVAGGAAAPFLAVRLSTLADPLGAAAGADFSVLLQPGTLLALVAWMAAAAACSLGCRRATRGGAFAGVLAGGAILATAYALMASLPGGPGLGPAAAALDLTIGVGLACLVAALGAPTRPEEE